jgi:thiol-disulfide isomerase/thioredoxin
MKNLRFILLLIVMVSVVQNFIQRNMQTGLVPELPVQTITGGVTAELILNKPAIIYFWGSWCGICTAISGTMSNIFQDYSGVSIALRSGNAATVQQYLQEKNLNWQVLNDNDGWLAEAFGVTAVPAVFIIGHDGQISAVTLGFVTEIGLRVRLWWASLDF